MILHFPTYLNSKTCYLLILSSLPLITIIFAAFSLSGQDDFELARQEILLRKVGHEILLHSGDSTSRVLPVQKVSENEYRLRFENEFSFQPDSLVKIIRTSLANDRLADNYIVNVLNCAGTEVVYGYAILKNKQNNLVPCSGRTQSKSCYMISLKFQKKGMTTSQKGMLIGGLPLLAFVVLISRSAMARKKQATKPGNDPEYFQFGNTLFESQKRNLIFEGTMTELTIKENKLLLILAQSPNALVERSRLQKEIWEDEGVIVGRSLDMFISKLRKKLERDSSVRLINIHGKGYKLEVSEY